VLAGIGSAPVHAGWDNVFQVTCWGCKSKPAVSGYCCAPPPCCPQPCCPQPVCTTQYVQRSYYQPVTCYQTKTYYEPVTCYRTSYYYEPVTSYTYSCYFDPCTCSYQQVACPQTCYRLRSQTCAVTSYLQRTCQVPVTSYQLKCYYEPVTTCCTPTCNPCPTPCPPAAGVTEQPSSAPPPAVKEVPSVPAPNGGEPRSSDYQRIYPSSPSAPGSTQGRPAAPAAGQPVQPPPTVKLDRIVAVPPTPKIQGVVVQADNKPRASATMLFVSEKKKGTQQAVTADRAGQFNVELEEGTWLVYLSGADGKLLYHSKVEVRGEANKPVMLVSR
jgi:hypothetical protein